MNSPGQVLSLRALIHEFFQQKFNHTLSGNVFKGLKCYDFFIALCILRSTQVRFSHRLLILFEHVGLEFSAFVITVLHLIELEKFSLHRNQFLLFPLFFNPTINNDNDPVGIING